MKVWRRNVENTAFGCADRFLLCDRRLCLCELKSEGVIHEARTVLGNRCFGQSIMSLWFRPESSHARGN